MNRELLETTARLEAELDLMQTRQDEGMRHPDLGDPEAFIGYPRPEPANHPPQGGTIIGLSGFAGVGKDAVADCLVDGFGFVKVGLADGMKRICAEVFDWDEEQLWGSSEKRNVHDARYPRDEMLILNGRGEEIDRTPDYLTPRFALQTLGTEFGRCCYENVWIEHALRVAKKLTTGGHTYTRTEGLRPVGPESYAPSRNVVIPDVRFGNEIAALKAVGRCYRIKRPGYEHPAFDHPSETEQIKFSDREFTGVIDNGGGSLEDLRVVVGALAESWGLS